MRIAIIVAARTIEELEQFLTNLADKTLKPEEVQIICIFDEPRDPVTMCGFPVTFFLNVDIDKGYIGLDKSYCKAVHLLDKDVYFVSVFSSKVELATKNWDEKLLAYVNLFPDNIYRIRISKNKNLRYGRNLEKALKNPENFSFITKEAVQALCAENRFILASDSGLEGAFFFLSDENFYDREIVASDINLKEYQFSNKAGITSMMIRWNFKILAEHELGIEYLREMSKVLANKIRSHPIYMAKQQERYKFLIGGKYKSKGNKATKASKLLMDAVDITYDYLKDKYGNL